MNFAEAREKWLRANVLPPSPDGSLALWQQRQLVLFPPFVSFDQLRRVVDFVREAKLIEIASSASISTLRLARSYPEMIPGMTQSALREETSIRQIPIAEMQVYLMAQHAWTMLGVQTPNFVTERTAMQSWLEMKSRGLDNSYNLYLATMFACAEYLPVLDFPVWADLADSVMRSLGLGLYGNMVRLLDPNYVFSTENNEALIDANRVGRSLVADIVLGKTNRLRGRPRQRFELKRNLIWVHRLLSDQQRSFPSWQSMIGQLTYFGKPLG